MNWHDKTINILEKRLKESRLDYDLIQKNKEYSRGEIDLFAQYNGNFLFFEVKTTDSERNYKKAQEQLNRAEYYFQGQAKSIYKFYVPAEIYFNSGL